MDGNWVKALRESGRSGKKCLELEREKSNVDVDKLASFMFTNEAMERNERLLDILKADPVFDKTQNYFRGREARIEASLARGKRLRQLQVKHNWSKEEYNTANELISEPTPYGLHASMFLITLREQGTPEQHERFLKKAEAYEYIGCYAQTELGHGSNVRGLETTATWNPDDKTFILHSPHLTSSKWWIGSLGKVANHAVVMAQLIIGGKPYGPHPFVVQIRDLKTHEPLENIHVGDIGPKFGYNTMDNGFLLFNKVKIPHANMLARFSGVDPNSNKYVRPSNPSLVYGTLTWVRSNIVLQSGSVLARGVTIAVRYCSVRRQFTDRDAPEDEVRENQVINYTMVQQRLFPLLAACFALHFTGRGMIELYDANQAAMKRKENPGKVSEDSNQTGRSAGPEELNPGADLLADLHSTSCALKSYASTVAGEGLEVCRRACGGHGYSSFSGIGSWYADYLPTLTWEGDNYMLTQQVSRYLLKSARAVLKNASKAGNFNAVKGDNDTTAILKTYKRRMDIGAGFDVLGNDEDLVAAYAWRVGYLTFQALQHRDEEKRSWNSLLVDFFRLSTAHAQYMVVKNFHGALASSSLQSSLPTATKDVLHSLFRLYALHTLEKESSEFFQSAACTIRQIQLARTKTVPQLMTDIRPHAVRLVDSWKFSDWLLDSSLGRYDGAVYEDMFKRASEDNPLNKVVFDPYPDSGVLFKKDERSSMKSKL
ncbi:hypothetical protein LTS08_002042 [Lithohypha guttulata]|uniref:Acyl-coenzyme A oxidase n=1 Tax=Lithohypha guttulata TaxID=1690604 RepID=A0AAN7TDK7_9EURO|nr:hypothetical protein LTR05_001229 [Lithohypha guttulata]KAK5104157.1 hypothetical protein LTS08_002042 [Lithohypha guttulata]